MGRGAAEAFGHLDILVNNAAQPGSALPPAPVQELTGDHFWPDMNVKVMGYLRCAREVVPYMIERKWGRIINISGLAARNTGSIIGSMRNVAIVAMTKNLADELGPQGINVTVVHPGAIRTERTPRTMGDRARRLGITSEEVEQRTGEGNSLRRLIEAREVAYVVAFLASPKAVSINGDVIVAGGGSGHAIYY